MFEGVVAHLADPRREIALVAEVLGYHPQPVADLVTRPGLAIVDIERRWSRPLFPVDGVRRACSTDTTSDSDSARIDTLLVLIRNANSYPSVQQ